MNTNALIGLVALIIVVGGGVWFFASKDANGLPTGGEGVTATANGSGTFAEFMTRGGTWSCTMSVNTPEAPTSGTMYISGDQLRGDLVSTPAALGGQEIESHMIRTDGYFYTWTSMTPQGLKVAAPADVANPGAAGQVVNLSAEVEYDCQPWVADGSKFELPAGITFVDVQAAVPQPN